MKISSTCGFCLYHLPYQDESVCQNDYSPRHGSFTDDWDRCDKFERWKPEMEDSQMESMGEIQEEGT